jgi:hypothetical protein
MSAEENKALVRRYVEEFVDRGNFDLSDEMFAPNFADTGRVLIRCPA